MRVGVGVRGGSPSPGPGPTPTPTPTPTPIPNPNPDTVLASERRSSLVPTQMIGTPGQWCLSSGNHFCLVFSYEARLASDKG